MDRLDITQGNRQRTSIQAPATAPRRRATLSRVVRLDLAVAVLFVNLLLAGCAHHHTTVQHATLLCSATCGDRAGGPHVEIIRGLGGYMPGSDELQERLAECGISSTVSCGIQSHGVARRILERRRAGNCCPIVLMAYATGGRGTMVIADDLAEHGICVDAVILLEPSFFEPVRSNVRYCFVAYKPEPMQQWNPIMRGLPVQVCSPATAVTLINLEEIDPCDRLDDVNHLTIPADPWVQQLLTAEAAGVFGR